MSEPRTFNALLVYPRFPLSYWGYQYALELTGKRSAMPPLGLLTVAAMFPAHYRLRLVDLNVAQLTDEDLDWADLVLTSTMVVQQRSLREVIARCNRRGKPVGVGGPHPTSFTLRDPGRRLLPARRGRRDLPALPRRLGGGASQRVYRPEAKPRSPRRRCRASISSTSAPTPRWRSSSRAAAPSIASSATSPSSSAGCRGRSRNEQMIAELDRLYEIGWRGPVFLVDDNFIGNKREALRLLPEIAAWQRARRHPFELFTEASVNLAKLEPLMDAMVDAGFNMVFLGIESPNPEALKRTKKTQNIDKGGRPLPPPRRAHPPAQGAGGERRLHPRPRRRRPGGLRRPGRVHPGGGHPARHGGPAHRAARHRPLLPARGRGAPAGRVERQQRRDHPQLPAAARSAGADRRLPAGARGRSTIPACAAISRAAGR